MSVQVRVSAPGKLMLFGEHAVVYGRPCIVTAVGQRMKATVELTDQPLFHLNAPDVSVENYTKPMSKLGQGNLPKGAKFVEVAIKNFSERYPLSGGVKVTTAAEFSSEFGFGSSSASTVCVIKALSELLGAKLSNNAVFKLAYQTVLDIQGTGSGFDVAAATFGGILYYVTPGKIIEPLKIDNLPLVVGYSGIKVDTVTLISEVAQKAEKYPWVIDNIYDQIGLLVNLAKTALQKGDLKSLGELMNFNGGYLEALGIGSRKLSDMIYAARSAGAYGAKLSGAGKGDCMIAIAPAKARKAVEQAINKAGGQVIDIKANVPGVRIEG